MPFEPPERFNIADHFLGARLEAGDGGRIALHLDHGDLTYDDVTELAARYAAQLADLGVRQEERVLVSLPDGEDYVGALFGILAAGAVVVMVNPELPTEQLAAIIDKARPPVAVVHADHVDGMEDALAEVDDPGGAGRDLRLLVVGGDAAGHERFQPDGDAPPWSPVTTHRDDPAIWLFSGGTTGAPKAVVQTHRSFANTTALYAQDAMGWQRGDITISVPKLYFGYATGSNLLFPFSVGASSHLFPERPTPEVLFERIPKVGATILVTVPKVVGQMCDHPAADGADLSTLRFATSAGEALPPALYERWMDTFGVPLYDGLGTAEMWHIFVSNQPDQVKPGTLGRPVPGFDVRVRDVDGNDVEPGEVGRLWVKGDSRALGYWQDMDQSTDAFVGPWYAGEDLVVEDDEGFITYVGRGDDAMKVSGKWLLPADVEGVLQQHDAVEECAVVGVADEQGLTKPVAFVVASGGAELEEELQQFVLEHLEAYKHPRRVHVVDELPRTHLGKVNRRELRDRADLAGGPAS